MPARIHVNDNPETLQEFELAANDRYWEGLELLVGDYPCGGIYLMGYVAEMLLKIAYLRYTGARPDNEVGPRLGPARRMARRIIPDVEHESYHSLRFWALLLLERRRQDDRPLPEELERAFRQRAHRLHQNWVVNMRYYTNPSEPEEGEHILEDVNWVRKNYIALWR